MKPAVIDRDELKKQFKIRQQIGQFLKQQMATKLASSIQGLAKEKQDQTRNKFLESEQATVKFTFNCEQKQQEAAKPLDLNSDPFEVVA